MPTIVNIADLECPGTGKSYRQVNAEREHKIPIGALVELENGCRLFVAMHTRDCDQTPLYSLTAELEDLNQNRLIPRLGWNHGYGEESLKPVQAEDEEEARR